MKSHFFLFVDGASEFFCVLNSYKQKKTGMDQTADIQIFETVSLSLKIQQAYCTHRLSFLVIATAGSRHRRGQNTERICVHKSGKEYMYWLYPPTYRKSRIFIPLHFLFFSWTKCQMAKISLSDFAIIASQIETNMWQLLLY